MNNFMNWFGVGVKGGGTLGLVGFETMEGSISNLGVPSHKHSLNMTYLRLGAGLGGGAGLCAIFVYNCSNPQNLHGTNDASWSINVSLGAKWSDVVKFMAKSKLFEIAPKLVNGFSKATKADLDNIRNSASYLYTVYEITDQTKNKVITIDIPFAGVGAEISAQKLYGTIYIGDLKTQSANIDKSGLPSGAKRIGEL